jgi:dTDP-3-amino-2,3,6-trideoxy-4-keto-D-glucose/dTDP-3-amino-3,4,6-trideoxy-alpha-D-glucose/dTDP-2,6-dideoxy-D-kanosamine transaminase
MMANGFVTYSKINDLRLHNHSISAELEDAIKRVLASGWYALGPEVDRFEQDFAAWCGAGFCRGLANGTDAIELGLRALGVEEGGEVIVAANAGMYSATGIRAIGATAVYADIDPSTFNIDAADVSQRINSRTQAIIATHLYGQLCDMPALTALAQQHQLPLLEDCAQAHGAALHGKRAGSWGDAAAFSFYPTKNLGALGDGGALVTSRSEVCEAVTQLRQYGWESRYNVVRSGGRNSRLDELQAAVLSVKLSHLEDWTRQRQAIGKFYAEHIRHPLVQVARFAGEQHVYHLYVVRCARRDQLKRYLGEQGIAADIHYPYLDYQQPLFAAHAIAGNRLPHSELAVQQILTLPCYPELGIADAKFVADAINAWKPEQ